MTLSLLVFIALAAVTVVGALAAVTLRNVTHTLLAVVAFFMGIAGLFFSLRADFLGAVQILVYVGAIAVLMVFSIVLTRSTDVPEPRNASGRLMGAGTAALLCALLVAGVLNLLKETAPAARLPNDASTDALGTLLLTNYAVPVEAASVLLTAALVGAVVIALDEIRVRRGGA